MIPRSSPLARAHQSATAAENRLLPPLLPFLPRWKKKEESEEKEEKTAKKKKETKKKKGKRKKEREKVGIVDRKTLREKKGGGVEGGRDRDGRYILYSFF